MSSREASPSRTQLLNVGALVLVAFLVSALLFFVAAMAGAAIGEGETVLLILLSVAVAALIVKRLGIGSGD